MARERLLSEDTISLRFRSRWFAVGAATLVTALLTYQLIFHSTFKTNDSSPVNESQPSIVYDGSKVVIPNDSPYRNRILVAPVEIKNILRTRSFPSVVEADPARTTNILPPVTGRVVGLEVRLGDIIKQGQALVRIESSDLAQALADQVKAHASVDLTRRSLDRTRDLSKIGGSSIRDYEQAQNDYAQATAELTRAEERLRVIGSKGQITGPQNITVTAPFSGTITTLNVAQGAYINDATTSMMTVANLENVFITANVPEKDLSFVHVGEAAQIELLSYPGVQLSGQVGTVNVILDPDTRRVKVRIYYNNIEGRLLPNMFGTVTVSAPALRVPVVPTSALVLLNDDVFVFVETAPWTFERRRVSLDADYEGQAVIRDGLKEREHVVIKGGVLLQ